MRILRIFTGDKEMKYIKNKLDHSICFKVMRNNKEETFSFDCFRTYSDTGNVASTGVTPISESDYEYLYTNLKVFKNFVDTGKLVNTSKAEANSVAGKLADYAKENEALKKELAETKKELGTGESKKLQEKDNEITKLKEELENLKKGKKSKAGKAESEKSDDTEVNGGF